jgi:hypothetical protein
MIDEKKLAKEVAPILKNMMEMAKEGKTVEEIETAAKAQCPEETEGKRFIFGIFIWWRQR